jgi:hypothetical protein
VAKQLDAAVAIRASPNMRNMTENASSSAAPATMKIARSARAATIPIVSARACCSGGTANVFMMIRKTNRLSTDRLFSTT